MTTYPANNALCVICGNTYQGHDIASGHRFLNSTVENPSLACRDKGCLAVPGSCSTTCLYWQPLKELGPAELAPEAPSFASILSELQAMHDKKSKDYGGNTGQDNIRQSESFGIPAWLGAIIRQNDKITRIKSFCLNHKLENESLGDTLIDNAVYAVLALQLYREKHAIEASERISEITS